MDVPSELREALSAGRCIAYIGSGFSAPARLPYFDHMLRTAAERGGLEEVVEGLGNLDGVPGTTPKDKLFHLQGVIVDKLGKEQASALFMEQLVVNEFPDDAMTVRLELLRRIPFLLIVTQNWDNILEAHAGYRRVVPATLDDYSPLRDVLQAGDSDERRLTQLKFEGDGGNPESFLLSGSEIDQLKHDGGEKSGRAFFMKMLAGHVVLFLGANVRGGYVGEFLRASAKGGSGNACFVPTTVDESEEEVQKLFDEYAVTSILCHDATDATKHPVDVLLRQLAEQE